MAIYQEHFIGFDPFAGAARLQGCPRLAPCATKLWFEAWLDTREDYGSVHNTGIIYTHCYACFDELGNLVSSEGGCGGDCCGFSGNLTADPSHKLLTPEEWLATARAACAPHNLPDAGTLEMCQEIQRIIGRRG